VISYQASSQAGALGWLGLFVDKSGATKLRSWKGLSPARTPQISHDGAATTIMFCKTNYPTLLQWKKGRLYTHSASYNNISSASKR
jgi:hypothetical protein